MQTSYDVANQIVQWKLSRNALILAHHYQDDEIQEVADFAGDALQIAQAAETFTGEVIVVCGVRFIAELAKVLNPRSSVLLPEANAGCSLVDSCPAAAIAAFRQSNPNHVVVSYINTSAAVKAESDFICTARNAVAVVNSIPLSEPILFLPDINLGNWVKRQTGRRNMEIWQGACIVHATFPARRLIAARFNHPGALVAAHPGCPAEILRMADFVGSIAAIVEWCASQSASEFIVCAESGIRHALQKKAPGKEFHFVANENCNCSECPYMRMNNLENLLTCLQNLTPSIELSEETIQRVRIPYNRMLQIQ